MAYTDSNQPDADVATRSQVARDKAKATRFDTEILFSHRSTYKGSEQALARLRSRAAADSVLPDD